jgi:hypothetical protein
MWLSAFEVRENIVVRAPAAPVALAAVVGIVADWTLSPTLATWWALLVVAAVLGGVLRRREPRGATLAFMLGIAAAFGVRHFLAMNAMPPEVEQFLSEQPSRPVQVEARMARPGWTLERLEDHSVATLGVLDDVQLVGEEGRRESFAARVRLLIENAAHELPAGTRIRALGRLTAPSTAGNPGGFDFRDWLHRQ